jgi:hypothetical protein
MTFPIAKSFFLSKTNEIMQRYAMKQMLFNTFADALTPSLMLFPSQRF